MNAINKHGITFYAVALIGFGVIQLITANFLTGLFPVPATFFQRTFFVYVTSGLLIASGAGILSNARPFLAATLGAATFLAFFALLHLPLLLKDLHNGSEWTGAFETLALASGAYIAASQYNASATVTPIEKKRMAKLAVLSRYLFAIAVVVFAGLHIVYEGFIESLVPAWMPAHPLFAYLVMAGFILSALSLITGIALSLACNLLGLMFLIWVLILHLPRAIMHRVEPEWASLFVALAMSGIAFCIARNKAFQQSTLNDQRLNEQPKQP